MYILSEKIKMWNLKFEDNDTAFSQIWNVLCAVLVHHYVLFLVVVTMHVGSTGTVRYSTCECVSLLTVMITVGAVAK